MSKPIENCPQPETPIRERAWTAEQVERAAENWETFGATDSPAMLRAYAATLRQQAEVEERDWLHLRDGVVVGTSRPDYENGRYVRVGKLPSEGGIYARPKNVPEIFPGTLEQLNNLSIKGESP